MTFELSDQEKELSSKLPCDFRATESEIAHAYSLFGEKNGIRPDLRILLGTWKKQTGENEAGIPDKTIPQLRIIVDNRLCLFFYSTKGKWVFDGYECGNYENYWTEFDWEPTGST